MTKHKTISECPVCHSRDLGQEFHLPNLYFDSHTPIGGTHTSTPPVLAGCHCNDCGVTLIHNKSGKCPACQGTGKFKEVTGSCGIEHYSTSYECPLCQGIGKI